MQLHKVASNDSSFVRDVPVHLRVASVNIDDKPLTPTIKTLGLIYESKNDYFRFEFKPDDISQWTTRTILSHAARIFDPLGFLAPVVITAKLLVQLAWNYAKDWDSPLPIHLVQKWQKWISDTININEITIPRQCIYSGASFHVFCDASTFAYAAVAYAVSEKDEKRIGRFVCAKSRVAPSKRTESVARLELAAAQLGTIVANQLIKAYDIDKNKITYWTDSLTVLWWLHATKKLNTFVANRVCSILEMSKPCQWKFVPTLFNPADIPSRGTKVETLKNQCNLVEWAFIPY